MQRGEIHMFSESPPSYRAVIEPTLVKCGEMMPVWYDSGMRSGTAPLPKSMDGPCDPVVLAALRSDQGDAAVRTALGRVPQHPGGQLDAAARGHAAAGRAAGRCGRALRAAVARLNEDKEFVAGTLKLIGFEPDYETGADIAARVRGMLVASPRGARLRGRLHQAGAEEVTVCCLAGQQCAWSDKGGADACIAVACCPRCAVRRRSMGASRARAMPFYKGKRLTVLVNYAAGGPTDIEGRLFARHIAKHIEGQPNIIVQNMDGAGGLTGTTWLGEVAPKDGTVMGYLTGAAWVYANEPREASRRARGL